MSELSLQVEAKTIRWIRVSVQLSAEHVRSRSRFVEASGLPSVVWWCCVLLYSILLIISPKRYGLLVYCVEYSVLIAILE